MRMKRGLGFMLQRERRDSSDHPKKIFIRAVRTRVFGTIVFPYRLTEADPIFMVQPDHF